MLTPLLRSAVARARKVFEGLRVSGVCCPPASRSLISHRSANRSWRLGDSQSGCHPTAIQGEYPGRCTRSATGGGCPALHDTLEGCPWSCCSCVNVLRVELEDGGGRSQQDVYMPTIQTGLERVQSAYPRSSARELSAVLVSVPPASRPESDQTPHH
eukprot:1880738-Rhodomonas_salina.1